MGVSGCGWVWVGVGGCEWVRVDGWVGGLVGWWVGERVCMGVSGCEWV